MTAVAFAATEVATSNHWIQGTNDKKKRFTLQMPSAAWLAAGLAWDLSGSFDYVSEASFGVGTLVMDQHLELKRIDARRRTAIIKMTGTLSEQPAGAGSAAHDGAFTVVEGTVTGEFIWDFAAGQLLSAETRFVLETALDTPIGRMKLEQDMSSFAHRVQPETSDSPERPGPTDTPQPSSATTSPSTDTD